MQLSGFSQQAIGGNVPNRMYNGLPVNAAIQLPVSHLAAPVVSPMPDMNDRSGASDLTYSPGLVETSGQLSQVQVFNAPTGTPVKNGMVVFTKAAGNTLLRGLFAG